MLLENYKKFYINPSFDNVNDLWSSILEYDFKDYDFFCADVKEFRKATVFRSNTELVLHSNGSTSTPRKFNLGPHSNFWLNSVERFVKFPHGLENVKILNLFSSSLSSMSSQEIYSLPSYTWHNWDGNGMLPIRHTIHYCMQRFALVPFLIKKSNQLGPLFLMGQPFNFLYLNSHKEFQDFLLKSGKILGIVPVDWEPFFKKKGLLDAGFHINDNCVNWTTGVNFYTCKFNTKHFLPTFVIEKNGISNLINLASRPKYPVDDLMKISNTRQKCSCGRWYLPFVFIPHVKFAVRRANEFIYDDSIVDRLDSQYYNLQFVQRGNIVDVLYISPDGMSKTDYSMIQDLLKGMEIVFIKNSYALLGEKVLPYWSGPVAKYYNFKPYRIF